MCVCNLHQREGPMNIVTKKTHIQLKKMKMKIAPVFISEVYLGVKMNII